MSERVRPEVVAGLEGILGRLMDFTGYAHATAEEYTLAMQRVGLEKPAASTAPDRHLRLVPIHS